MFPDEAGDFAGFDVAVGLQLGEKQIAIDGELKTASIGGYQGEGFDLRLEFFQQLGCQTDSPVGVVSDRTVDQVKFQQH